LAHPHPANLAIQCLIVLALIRETQSDRK